jgi:hypothetical protein
MKAVEALDSIIQSYEKLLKMCYDALAADVSQEERDKLRKSIEAADQG